MSDKNNFTSGFLLGTLVGGVLGGVIGTVLATKNNISAEDNEDNSFFKSSSKSSLDNPEIKEDIHLGLEEKINLLNHAIDDVRVTLLKNVNSQEKEPIKE
jgi:hypothetical protein